MDRDNKRREQINALIKELRGELHEINTQEKVLRNTGITGRHFKNVSDDGKTLYCGKITDMDDEGNLYGFTFMVNNEYPRITIECEVPINSYQLSLTTISEGEFLAEWNAVIRRINSIQGLSNLPTWDD
jgi:hypothetical protein